MYFNLQIPITLHKSNYINNLIENCTNFRKVNAVFRRVSDVNQIEENSWKIRSFINELNYSI